MIGTKIKISYTFEVCDDSKRRGKKQLIKISRAKEIRQQRMRAQELLFKILAERADKQLKTSLARAEELARWRSPSVNRPRAKKASRFPAKSR